MSGPEHLMEHAISDLENYDPYEAHQKFFGDEKNVRMAAAARIPLETVWEMAVYVMITWYPGKMEERWAEGQTI